MFQLGFWWILDNPQTLQDLTKEFFQIFCREREKSWYGGKNMFRTNDIFQGAEKKQQYDAMTIAT